MLPVLQDLHPPVPGDPEDEVPEVVHEVQDVEEEERQPQPLLREARESQMLLPTQTPQLPLLRRAKKEQMMRRHLRWLG